MSELRDFLYIDSSKLHSFVSQIQGGLISEISDKIKQLGGLSAGLDIGIPPFKGKVDTSKTKESERHQTIKPTDPVYYDVIYRHLSSENNITDITASSIQTRNNINIGQFIEMRGSAESPIVESWIEKITSTIDFFERNNQAINSPPTQGKGRAAPGVPISQVKQIKGFINLVIDFINMSRQDPGKQYIRITSEKQSYAIWCGLIPEYIVAPLQSILPTEIRVLGRVEKIITEENPWKIVDFTQLGQLEQSKRTIDMINGFNAIVGRKPISEDDLTAQYPDIIVSPIAIYR